MVVDLDYRLTFPTEITTTSLRPDLLVWSSSLKALIISKLTVPWENSVCEANKRKHLRYAELVPDARQIAWKV